MIHYQRLWVHRSHCAGLAVLVATIAIGCKGEAEGDEAGTQPTAVEVRTALVTSEPFTETLSALGTVTARPGHLATLSAPAPTRVTQVLAAEGQRVKAGAPLVVFEQNVFGEAARSAQAKLTAAQRAEERARTLSNAGILPRKDVEQATADLASARAELAAARRTAQLSVLRSPISGVVTRMSATLGASVDANQPLVEVADPSALDVVLAISPTDAARIRPGNRVELRAGQNISAEKLGVGAVKDIAAQVDSATRNVAVRVSLPASVRPLRIGETIYGELAIDVRPNALTVPLEALVPDGDGFRVFVVDAKNVARATSVTVGARDSRKAEITKGLAVGARVVTFGAYGLEGGSTVIAAK